LFQYESPPKHIQDLQAAALKRVRAVKQEEKEYANEKPLSYLVYLQFVVAKLVKDQP